MSDYWNKYLDEDPIHHWPENGSFELEKLLYLKGIFESSHNKPYWYLWEFQIEKENTKKHNS